MTKLITLSVGGSMNYNQRLQLLDLLFWRVIQYGSRNELELRRSGILPEEAGVMFSSAYEDAERTIDSFRSPAEIIQDTTLGLLEDDYMYRTFRRRTKETETPAFFYPALVQVRYERSLLDELLSQERLGLASASLATAALSFELYRVEAIQSLNPLKIKITLKDALAVIGILVLAIHSTATALAEYGMAEGCVNFINDYQSELAKKHIDAEHAQMLSSALKACYSSPIFNASPINLEMGHEQP